MYVCMHVGVYICMNVCMSKPMSLPQPASQPANQPASQPTSHPATTTQPPQPATLASRGGECFLQCKPCSDGGAGEISASPPLFSHEISVLPLVVSQKRPKTESIYVCGCPRYLPKSTKKKHGKIKKTLVIVSQTCYKKCDKLSQNITKM